MRFKTLILIIVCLSIVFYSRTIFAQLSCSVTTAAACTNPSVVIMRMSSTTNAHAELPSQSNAAYSNSVVCCSGVTGLGNTCVNSFAVVAKLQNTTNSHAELNSQLNYGNNICIAAPSGTMTVANQDTNCTGYDTTIASISSTTNAHVANGTVYTKKICGKYLLSNSITFSISSNSIGFGTLNATTARFATANGSGSTTEVEAHTVTAATNAPSGYSITVRGATMTFGAYSINAIGGTNTTSSIGSEQFGVRLNRTSGNGTIVVPYAAAGFAYAATSNTTSQIASVATGDSADTVYSVRYIANISPTTESATYTSNIQYIATSNF